LAVNNVNDAPVITSTAVTSVTVDNTYTYTLSVTDADAGDTLVITAPTLPDWLALTDNGDGTATLSGVPANSDGGISPVFLQVSDGTTIAIQTFDLTVDGAKLEVASTSIGINSQTGLVEQVFRVDNPTLDEVSECRLTFSNTTRTDYVYNPTGTDASGDAYIDFIQVIKSGGSAEVTVTLHSVNRLQNESLWTVTVEPLVSSSVWGSATGLGGGWRHLDWFGVFYADSFPWLYHPQLGWTYQGGSDAGDLWMWQGGLGWVWTSATAYPNLYRANTDSWVWFEPNTSGGTSQLYNYDTQLWEDFSQ
jgi:hypothetical protein